MKLIITPALEFTFPTASIQRCDENLDQLFSTFFDFLSERLFDSAHHVLLVRRSMYILLRIAPWLLDQIAILNGRHERDGRIFACREPDPLRLPVLKYTFKFFDTLDVRRSVMSDLVAQLLLDLVITHVTSVTAFSQLIVIFEDLEFVEEERVGDHINQPNGNGRIGGVNRIVEVRVVTRQKLGCDMNEENKLEYRAHLLHHFFVDRRRIAVPFADSELRANVAKCYAQRGE
mmetsp:Transcript_5958/g.13113  ORF Transcript_5958/g.13113 Transcript_5958/m.13113 type:complete len:232 (-) Transcript_5958:2510-3205(-)